ncbi:MAG: nucleoside triphosphate pyrophosphohydrolase [Candidatus Neomarinimicrobiota bacterium]
MKENKALEQFNKLLDIVAKLRGPDGCPWDKEQTHESLLPYFLEEAYEVIESVEEKNWDNLKEELGDVMLHLALQWQISAEQKKFSIVDSLENINKKLIHRHPHVFGDKKENVSSEANKNWEDIKHQEKKRESRLDGVPSSLPALTRAHRLQQKASSVGFDWDDVNKVWEKFFEEIDELKIAYEIKDQSNIEEEMGDLLFSVVNLARHLKLDSEDILRRANRKFIKRFKAVEEELKIRGTDISKATLAEMDAIWEQIKREVS